MTRQVEFIHRRGCDDYQILIDGVSVFNDNRVDEVAVKAVAEELGAEFSESWNVEDDECDPL